jgi:hypothetical protein
MVVSGKHTKLRLHKSLHRTKQRAKVAPEMQVNSLWATIQNAKIALKCSTMEREREGDIMLLS